MLGKSELEELELHHLGSHKSLFLSISETELRFISNWYVHRHIVFETSGLVITGGVAFLRLLVGYLR